MTTSTAPSAATTDDLLAEVDRIRPILEEFAPVAEEQRYLASEAYQAMLDARLFDMLAPRAYGGFEFHPIEAMKVWEAVSRIDSAAAWNLVMNQSIATMAAFLPDEGAQEIYGNGPTTVAGGFWPFGAGREVDGGWRVTAHVSFASGCDHAKWFLVPAVQMDGDEPRIDPDSGQPMVLGAMVPRDEAEVIDTWHTMGMRGSGSSDVRVSDVFVPSHRTFAPGPLTEAATGLDGPLFRMFPFTVILGETIVSVGIAASAVDDLIDLVRDKTPNYNATPLKEQQLAQFEAGRAQALVHAARDTLYRAADEAYDEAEASGQPLSWDAKIRLQLAVSFAAETSAEAVRLVHNVAGASGIRLEAPFERYFRDVHVLTQHTSKARPRYAHAGKLMFGLENDWIWLSF